MTKYIIEIDSDKLGAVQFLEDFISDNINEIYSFATRFALWEDDGSTFVSKGDILYEG